jgi:hypothetical protein
MSGPKGAGSVGSSIEGRSGARGTHSIQGRAAVLRQFSENLWDPLGVLANPIVPGTL